MDDLGFKKIDLQNSRVSDTKPAQPMSVSRRKGKFRFLKSKKFLRIGGVVGGVLLIIILVSVYLAIQAATVYKDVKAVQAQGRVAADMMKQQNVELAKEELVKTKDQLAILQSDFKKLGIIKFFPFVSGYYKDAEHGFRAGEHGIDAAIIATDSLIPYADVLGLKGQSSFSQGSAEDRIRLAVKTMGKVVPKIDEIDAKLALAQSEIKQINPERYPEFWVFKDIKPQIIQIQTLVDEGVLAVNQGKPLIKVLPELLGESESKKYLILFQNDNEQRPTGGFLTFYSIFRVEEGVIKVDTSSDIYDLDNSISSHPAAPYIISEYLPKVNRLYIRDSNLSPDFPTSMETFFELWEKSPRSTDIDGVIAIDTKFLVNLLTILGEVNAGGLTFKPDMDERCNCPQAVYVLNDNITRPVNYERDNRKALLGELLFATMNKALSSSPSEYWGRLFQQALKDAQEKHILMMLENEDAQKGIEALNWGGRIKDFEGDYIHVNDANFAGAKSNLYVRQSVKMEYTVADNGEITKKVTLTYKNPEKHSDCNLERGGLCLNATLRNFERVYVPKGSEFVDSKGSEVKVQTKEDLGKTYFESFFTVKPLGKSEISYTYKLPFLLDDKSELPVLIQKQPGTYPSPYEIYVNGELVESFDLASDKQLNLKVF